MVLSQDTSIVIVFIITRFIGSYYFDLEIKDVVSILTIAMCIVFYFLNGNYICSIISINVLALMIVVNKFFYLEKKDFFGFLVYILLIIYTVGIIFI